MQKLFEEIKTITNQDHKTLEQRALKTSEETGELAQAVLSYVKASGTSYKNLGKGDIVEESVDVFLCAIAMAIHADDSLTADKFLDYVNLKMEKWKSKI